MDSANHIISGEKAMSATKISQPIRFLVKAIQETAQFLLEAVISIFSPTDDNYPATGLQPFTGEPADEKPRHA